jgi:hypothetical protein
VAGFVLDGKVRPYSLAGNDEHQQCFTCTWRPVNDKVPALPDETDIQGGFDRAWLSQRVNIIAPFETLGGALPDDSRVPQAVDEPFVLIPGTLLGQCLIEIFKYREWHALIYAGFCQERQVHCLKMACDPFDRF